jgi:hypothetical protein
MARPPGRATGATMPVGTYDLRLMVGLRPKHHPAESTPATHSLPVFPGGTIDTLREISATGSEARCVTARLCGARFASSR